MEEKPVMLMILDGFGINENKDGNAIKLAKTPNIDKLMKKYQTPEIYTSGLQVGLPVLSAAWWQSEVLSHIFCL